MKLSNENKIFFDFLKRASKCQKIIILRSLSVTQLRLLTEIIYNILHGNIPLSGAMKDKLKRYKGQLRKVTVRSLSRIERKRRLINIQNYISIIIEVYLNHESGADLNPEEKIRQPDGIEERGS